MPSWVLNRVKGSQSPGRLDTVAVIVVVLSGVGDFLALGLRGAEDLITLILSIGHSKRKRKALHMNMQWKTPTRG